MKIVSVDENSLLLVSVPIEYEKPSEGKQTHKNPYPKREKLAYKDMRVRVRQLSSS
jgi:hypothetical protein